MRLQKFFPNIYPIYFVIYPLIYLITANLGYVAFRDTIRIMSFAIFGFGLVWLIIWFVTKSLLKANGLVSLFAFLFFSYGHVYLIGLNWIGDNFSHRYLLLSYALVAFLVIILIDRNFRSMPQNRGFLNIFSLILIGTSLFQIVLYELKVQQNPVNPYLTLSTGEGASKSYPDVYLIILDAHTRSDILLQDYGLDNSEFVSSLEQLGFYVADCSQSNYLITDLSLQSLFNMDYIHKFVKEGDVLPGLKNSAVNQILKTHSYKSFSFNNYFSSHYDFDPDFLIERNSSITERVNFFMGLSEYESLVVETSALRLMIDFQYLLDDYFGDLFSDEGKYYSHYLETLFILEELKDLPESSSQKFVFAHIAVPHWPYVFSVEGDYDHKWNISDKEGYPKNVSFIDQQIVGVVEEIISKSEDPPVIILMGDHGPTGEDVPIESRISNLYAVYSNQGIINQLNPLITPVNTFRLIFNNIFSTDYALLEDISYRIWNIDSYNLDQIIPNTCIPQ